MPVLPAAFLLCSLSRADPPLPVVIFAATRYRATDGRIDRTGPCHIYSVNLDGSGLRQLTFGPDDDTDPGPASGGRVAFSRSPHDSDSVASAAPYEVELSGKHLRRLSSGTAPPTSDPGVLGPRLADYVPRKWIALDRHTQIHLGVGHGGLQGPFGARLLVARDGQIVRDLKTTSDPKTHRQPGLDYGDSAGGYTVVAKARWISKSRNLAVLWTDEANSLGSPGTTDIVNLATGKMTHVDNQILADVSPDGSKLLTYTWDAGGPGEDRLFIWNSRTLRPKQTGFRFMEVRGACFVPGNRPDDPNLERQARHHR